ncbi:MAG: HEAT repeat domain-containing protein, partial [Desertifilum sp. SIO1I2]|nr:HEAT repeat domain-containing protein [Desertifilum sp. SIO1I2]
MHKQNQPQWLGAIAIAFLSLSFPLLFAEAALANPKPAISAQQQETEAQEINRLIEQLKTDDELEWHNTIQKLAARGESALPYLIASVSHPDMRVRLGTISVLEAGHLQSLAFVSLSEKLGNSQQDAKVRRYISQALLLVLHDGYFWEEQDWSSAIPVLTSALEDSDALVRRSAAYALGKIGAEAKSAIPALTSALQDPDDSVRRSAASALGRMGAEAKSAIPALTSALQDPDNSVHVRINAAGALVKIGAEAKSAIPALILALQDPDDSVRMNATFVLASMGAEAKSAIPALILVLQDPDDSVRMNAAGALASMGAEAKSAIPALILAFKDSNASVRMSATSALGRMGAEAKSAIPALILALQDPDDSMRMNAAGALGSMGAEAKSAIPALILALKDSNDSVRGSATSALGSMGAEAKSAIPELVNLLPDDSFMVLFTLGSIASSLEKNASQLTNQELDKVIQELNLALKIAEDPTNKFSVDQIDRLRYPLNVLKEIRRDRLFKQAILQNPWAWVGIFYLIILPSFWLVVLR